MKSYEVYNLIIIILLGIVIVLSINYFSNNGSNSGLYIMPVKLMDSSHIKLDYSDNVEKSIDDRTLPASFDLWSTSVNVVDQGPWGSCTAYSLRYAYLLRLSHQNLTLVEPSTSYIYDQSRLHEGNNNLNDTGATNTDTAWVVQNLGVPPLSNFPYTAYNLFHSPTNVTGQVKLNMTKLTMSSTISTNVSNFKNILSQNKALIIAFYVYSSMMTVNVYISGIIPMPGTFDKLLGGHSIALTGWNDSTQTFVFRNSWGTYTGANGLFTIPYNYIANPKYASDVWYFTN